MVPLRGIIRGAGWPTPVPASEGAVTTLERYRDFGDVAISKYCTGPMIHSLELMPIPPNEDEDRWVEASIAYAKSAFAEFL